MSLAPNLPKRTRSIVKDLLFQEKHNLSHSQMDLMAYLVNIPFWALAVGDDFYVITSNKIISDIPYFTSKTLEFLFKALEDKKLIERKLVKVEEWKGSHQVRSVRLTEAGKLYNDHLVLPTKNKEFAELKKEYKELKTQKEALEKKLEEVLANVSFSEEEKEPKKYKTNQDLSTFIKETTRDFAITGEAICNCVPKWVDSALFYINSYNKLSIKQNNEEEKQIKDASKIHAFWLWLFENQDRIGECIDLSKPLDLAEVKRKYIGVQIEINGQEAEVYNFVSGKEGVAIEVKKDKQIIRLVDMRDKSKKFYPLELCEKMILGLQKG